MPALSIERGVSLAQYTSLELGGPAEYFARVRERSELLEALDWARRQRLPVTLLGGGSNVLVSDRGVPGLVLLMATRGVTLQPGSAADSCVVSAQAGDSWDELVARSVAQALGGLECLSGIPGSVGAAPIQNIGAYGQELSSTLRAVEVLELDSLQSRWLDASECAFGYRQSRWKQRPGREIVLSVQLELTRHARPCLRYPELVRALGQREPSLSWVRQTVLELRRGKSMLLEPGTSDPNRRSAGSFFLNPVVSAAEVGRICELALQQGLIRDKSALPQYAQPDGTLKLSAAWLIERSGTQKGERHGQVGVSSQHSLALVHHGGATSAELLSLAREIRERVRKRFGITLVPEPVLLGFEPDAMLA